MYQRASITNVNNNVNIYCAAYAVSEYIYLYLVNLASNSINIDEYVKIENKTTYLFTVSHTYVFLWMNWETLFFGYYSVDNAINNAVLTIICLKLKTEK